jgi:hypothetical protein
VVRDVSSLDRRKLRCANVKAPVCLNGVTIYDLPVEFPGQKDCQATFAGPGRTHDGDQRQIACPSHDFSVSRLARDDSNKLSSKAVPGYLEWSGFGVILEKADFVRPARRVPAE